jgi:hypothetical protein
MNSTTRPSPGPVTTLTGSPAATATLMATRTETRIATRTAARTATRTVARTATIASATTRTITLTTSASALVLANASPRPNEASSLPELDGSEYLRSVLELSAGQSDSSIEEELVTKATSLGISTRRPLALNADDSTSSTASGPASTPATSHSRTFSVQTDDTEHSLIEGLVSSPWDSDSEQGSHISINGSPRPGGALATRSRPNPLSFSLYDKYLSQIDQTAIGQQRFIRDRTAAGQSDARGLRQLAMGTRRSYTNLKRSIKTRLRFRRRRSVLSSSSAESASAIRACVCCCEEFDQSNPSRSLPCGHSYCNTCLRVMVNQATTDESRMPPRCCTQPIPSDVVQSLFITDEQKDAFLRKVVEFSVPCEYRVFCTNRRCGEFIPPRHHPKHPFVAVCTKCKIHVCTLCRRDAHGIGNDCPQDTELEAVLRLGESSGWRRCYKCKTLVELSYGCTHMICRCSAQFCYICGAVWNRQMGCPNLCSGEEELERRRERAEARAAQREADDAARQAEEALEAQQRAAAERRTRDCTQCQAQRWRQEAEMERHRTYVRKSRWLMWARHSQEKLDLTEKYTEQMGRMKERHSKTALHLEDRQVAAEMELRATHEQAEKGVQVRLKHIERYCSGQGPPPGLKLSRPLRVVHERDLMELGQQYREWGSMDRLHESRVNVLRDKQAKSMEQLLERQQAEFARLEERRDEDTEELGARFAEEEDEFAAWFAKRAATMRGRWAVQCAILKREREEQTGQEFALLEIPWLDGDGDVEMDERGATEEQQQRQQEQQQQREMGEMRVAITEGNENNGITLLKALQEDSESEVEVEGTAFHASPRQAGVAVGSG